MRKTIAALLLAAMAVASPAHAKWREASTRHFVVYSEQNEKALREFATKLERYDWAMRTLRDLPDEPISPANRVTVYVVSNIADVRELAGEKRSNSGWGVAGFYIPRASGSIAFVPRKTGGNQEWDLSSQAVLLHEYAHHFMMQNFPAAFPAWFIEGYAEFMGSASFDADGTVNLGMPATHRAVGLYLGSGLPMEKLLTSAEHKLTAEQEELVYGRGWLLTHYLTFDPGRKGQLREYLKRLNAGEANLEAARAVFGDLKKLDRELDTYLRRNKFTTWKVTPQQAKIGDVALRDVSPAEEAVMDVKIRSKRGVTTEEAKKLVVEARRVAAPYPNDAAAQAMLAEAEYDAGNYAEAAAAADRAVAANPKSADGLLYLGRARLALAEKADDAAAAVKEARKPIIAANRLDPEDPEPLMLYYESFASAGERPPAIAATGLVRALELAPQDMSLRMMVAHQHLVDGKGDEAKAVLQPIAFAPHGGGLAKAARDIIAAIDKGGAKAALEASVSATETESSAEGS